MKIRVVRPHNPLMFLIKEEISNFINEISVEDAYNKFYGDIDSNVYGMLVNSDPTYNPNKNNFGKYSRWIMDMYQNKKLKNEDIYKIKPALELFIKFQNQIAERDLNRYQSPQELFKALAPFTNKQTKGEEIRNIKEEGAEKVYEDEDWIVLIPKTKQAACYYGKGTQWCTAADKSENMFDHYNEKGSMYILINKKTQEKYQFHYVTGDIKDAEDADFNDDSLYKKYPRLGQFMKSQFPKIKQEAFTNKNFISPYSPLWDSFTPDEKIKNFHSYIENPNSVEMLSDWMISDWVIDPNIPDELIRRMYDAEMNKDFPENLSFYEEVIKDEELNFKVDQQNLENIKKYMYSDKELTRKIGHYLDYKDKVDLDVDVLRKDYANFDPHGKSKYAYGGRNGYLLMRILRTLPEDIINNNPEKTKELIDYLFENPPMGYSNIADAESMENFFRDMYGNLLVRDYMIQKAGGGDIKGWYQKNFGVKT